MPPTGEGMLLNTVTRLGGVVRTVVGAVVLTLIGALATGSLGPWIDWGSQKGYALLDAATCKGHAAMAEGDRLSGLAENDLSQSQPLFEQANGHYAKAYSCGFPDAGIRLAVAHCMGLGTPKNLMSARQLVLEIESSHPNKAGRAADVRKLCGL